MNRRKFLLATVTALVSQSGSVFAQANGLQSAFMALSAGQRKIVQQELQTAGFYSGVIDGKYGRGTASALQNAAEFIDYNSGGRVKPDVRTATGSQIFLLAIASGEMAAWLYGEGGESDM